MFYNSNPSIPKRAHRIRKLRNAKSRHSQEQEAIIQDGAEFTCEYCEVGGYSSEQSLKAHVKSMHPLTLSSEIDPVQSDDENAE